MTATCVLASRLAWAALGVIVCAWCVSVDGSNITNVVFGGVRYGMPVAFGDFNSDELTDVFVLHNERRTVEVFLAAEEEPLLRSTNLKCDFQKPVTSVVPGDFDGDAFMDILVTTAERVGSTDTAVHIVWGGLDHVNCSRGDAPVARMLGQPLVLDYNQDMIMDMFGTDERGRRAFWIFNNRSAPPRLLEMAAARGRPPLRLPHSHAVIDLNGDFMADLFLTTERDFEVWHGVEDGEFVAADTVELPRGVRHVGQSLFVDAELVGRMDLVTPVCRDDACHDSAVMVHARGTWHELRVDLKDADGTAWHFVRPGGGGGGGGGGLYADAVTVRSGDFNLDGYPDLLASLAGGGGAVRAVLLENVPCTAGCGNYSRTFAARWRALDPFGNGSVLAAFYDFYQDGVLDVVVVQRNASAGGGLSAGAFRNTLDYDANFVKVMVVTGLSNARSPTVIGRLGKKKRTYGTNLPGPRVSYRTTTQEGSARHAASAQLPQSAHSALGLPFTTFGLGRTPNFVDSLTVGLCNRSRDWPQIIPNSQMVVIPRPARSPAQWRAQLFVTPSKLILMSVAALTAVCGLITVTIAALYWRERQEDKKERLQEPHRFHFDAM